MEELIEEMHVGETDAIKMDALIDFIVRSRCLLTASQKVRLLELTDFLWFALSFRASAMR